MTHANQAITDLHTFIGRIGQPMIEDISDGRLRFDNLSPRDMDSLRHHLARAGFSDSDLTVDGTSLSVHNPDLVDRVFTDIPGRMTAPQLAVSAPTIVPDVPYNISRLASKIIEMGARWEWSHDQKHLLLFPKDKGSVVALSGALEHVGIDYWDGKAAAEKSGEPYIGCAIMALDGNNRDVHSLKGSLDHQAKTAQRGNAL